MAYMLCSNSGITQLDSLHTQPLDLVFLKSSQNYKISEIHTGCRIGVFSNFKKGTFPQSSVRKNKKVGLFQKFIKYCPMVYSQIIICRLKAIHLIYIHCCFRLETYYFCRRLMSTLSKCLSVILCDIM